MLRRQPPAVHPRARQPVAPTRDRRTSWSMGLPFAASPRPSTPASLSSCRCSRSASTPAAVEAVKRSGLLAAVYANRNDARGIGIVAMDEDPAMFAESFRALLTAPPFDTLTPLPDFTMLGRTYAQGREADLKDFLLNKVPRNVLNPRCPWAVWYPLRRIGAYNRLSRADQGKIMMEHGMLGRRYGEAGFAADVRLECHGIDRDDNEFVIG